MGNNPSTNNRPSHQASPSPSHDSSRTSSTRRNPRNLIQAQRAPAEPSMAQARGTTTATHRTRNSQSHSTAAPFSTSSPSQSVNSPSYHSSDSQMGAQISKDEPKVEVRDQPSKPVDVPAPTAMNIESASTRSYSQSIEPSGPPLTQDMSYHLTRPPRLPLPIEEEVHTPGSPIIAPADVDAPALDIESLDHETLPRRSSALSNTTIDEEDAEELRVDKTGATVPTTFEWQQGGEKVYVTGTIFQWNKKHRLHPVPGKPGLLRAVIHVRPGTHHIRFIVDGLMQCSTLLPTTVDFGNNLVNYIEVSADDLPREVPVAVEGTGTPVSNVQAQAQTPPKNAEPKANVEPHATKVKVPPRTKPVIPVGKFSSQIPQYLVDLDKAEDSAAYQYAAAAIEKLPTPPSLPGFLGKPILNAATPMKDDNSVLTMPNHTVLNHLATSSIKNNVLAVSATTRYKRKYVTTIMYKPTGDD
ncbi:AMPKBI-domain-containing protein [Mollisia scopiformis]|uniref:AMPKBI-domain-containing protein n=1 Tax=Mollisia scopiformis TaxID=149040 RepID=A0A194XK90_MOLSC|nr:AMPKBI-domain-containing protein [Mollisia scopiformis]KUJ20207.1 AMPKBI-domain-containing protein [Mollisia scopiformis]